MGNAGHSKSLPGTPNIYNHGPAVTYKSISKKRSAYVDCRNQKELENIFQIMDLMLIVEIKRREKNNIIDYADFNYL